MITEAAKQQQPGQEQQQREEQGLQQGRQNHEDNQAHRAGSMQLPTSYVPLSALHLNKLHSCLPVCAKSLLRRMAVEQAQQQQQQQLELEQDIHPHPPRLPSALFASQDDQGPCQRGLRLPWARAGTQVFQACRALRRLSCPRAIRAQQGLHQCLVLFALPGLSVQAQGQG